MANPHNGRPPVMFDLGDIADLGYDGFATLLNHEPSTWLRDQVEDLRTRWESGGTVACAHVVTGTARTTVAALWRRDTVTCAHCVAVFRHPGHGACDRCQRDSQELQGLVYHSARLAVLIALCTICYEREIPA